MVVILDPERLDPSLPDVARGAVMAMVPPCVCRQKPLHPAPLVAILVWPDHQVVGHQAVPQHVHENVSASVDYGLDEGVVITGLEEVGLAGCPDSGCGTTSH